MKITLLLSIKIVQNITSDEIVCKRNKIKYLFFKLSKLVV